MHEPIVNPLWELMLATNACFPGCSCEQDRFDMTPLAVALWAQAAGLSESGAALEQLRIVIDGVTAGRIEREALSRQTNVYFRNDTAALDWLRRWEPLIESALRDGPSAIKVLQAGADLARRFERKGRRR